MLLIKSCLHRIPPDNSHQLISSACVFLFSLFVKGSTIRSRCCTSNSTIHHDFSSCAIWVGWLVGWMDTHTLGLVNCTTLIEMSGLARVGSVSVCSATGVQKSRKMVPPAEYRHVIWKLHHHHSKEGDSQWASEKKWLPNGRLKSWHIASVLSFCCCCCYCCLINNTTRNTGLFHFKDYDYEIW